MSEAVKNAKRIVFKIGSSTLMSETSGFDGGVIHQLVALWSDLHKNGKDIILVSSGAIGLGWGDLGLQKKPSAIPEKQASAAIGQTKLMTMYDAFFSPCGIGVGQILLTRDDLSDRRRYLNARNTLNVLLQDRIIPIINENDTVAFEEIKFGENDTLSAMVGGLIDADLVVLLSDIEGLYSDDPRRNPQAEMIKEVREINDYIYSIAGGVGTEMGSGGMRSKVDAAKIAAESGIPLVITNGKKVEQLRAIFRGDDNCTIFYPHKHGLRHKDRWIAHGSALAGSVVADNGAVAALKRGKSLLPVGIGAVNGDFQCGDVIAVLDIDGKEIARGIANYDFAEAAAVKGKKSSSENGIYELIHCDNLVLKD